MIDKNLSIIIPTYKRERQVLKIFETLNEQLENDMRLEIILCDSESNYNFKKFPNLKKNIIFKKLNVSENVLSVKRNYGIQNSSFTNIVLLDDDCIPEQNFLKIYIDDFNKIDDQTILSGIVNYPKEYLLKSNYIKFRNSKHFKYSEDMYSQRLATHQIVAMNLGLKKSNNFIKIGLFDKRFHGYGFEDYEFAFRYESHNYKLSKTKASILHDEGEPIFDKYLNKYYHLGRDGMKNLKIINQLAAEKTVYHKIEKNFFFQIFTKFNFFKFLLLNLEKLIIFFDKFNLLNFKLVYETARLFSYTRGYIDRKKTNINALSRNWYE